MIKICFILLGLLPLGVIAQEKGTWSVSAHFQSEHNIRSNMRSGYFYPNVIEPMIQKRFHYTTGFGINYLLDNNLEISSGIRYSRKKEAFNYYPILYCGTGLPTNQLFAPATRHYLEIPVLARYYFLPGKVKLHVESGWIASYQLQNTSKSEFSSFVLSPQAGLGVNLFLNRWQFALGGNYRVQHELGDRFSIFGLSRHAIGIEFKTAFSLNN